MKKGYSLDVDFYAIGCVMYFLMTNKLLLDKENKPPSIQVVETSLRERKVSVDAINLIKHLLTDVKIASAQGKCFIFNIFMLLFSYQDGLFLYEDISTRSSTLL
jgi:hypothetical protein